MMRGNKLVAGLMAGAVVDSTMGLLVAPKTGKESRQMVAEGTSHWRHKAGGAFQNLRQKPCQEPRTGSIKESFNRHLIITK